VARVKGRRTATARRRVRRILRGSGIRDHFQAGKRNCGPALGN